MTKKNNTVDSVLFLSVLFLVAMVYTWGLVDYASETAKIYDDVSEMRVHSTKQKEVQVLGEGEYIEEPNMQEISKEANKMIDEKMVSEDSGPSSESSEKDVMKKLGEKVRDNIK
ncbi:hypothetical protein COY23_02520 [bacterium (Candidatus Torokbacteria) CG_4_10_14_0_2_um_filter_35_8]|nr:MAG: hypothetical protein COY23_02520 [bacterium (Candidatus Torokbacteria) CG_4_10_14_0_2_um_filter_35_8]